MASANQQQNKKNKRGQLRAQWRGRQASPQALEEMKSLLGYEPYQRDLLIEYLHKIQDKYQFISRDHLQALAELMKLSASEVFEVASFYHHFDLPKDNESAPPPLTIRVCESLSCEMQGAHHLIAEIENALVENNLSELIRVQKVPCIGRCDTAPMAVVGMNTIAKADPLQVLDAAKKQQTSPQPFQETIAYSAYCEQDGYSLYRDCMAGKFKADDIISELENANLRGLGGAGFPTGRKWRILSTQAKPRLVAINIDEGEPGTMKDRYYLERDPHRFLEGSLIAAWAIEAKAIYIYLRDEYAACRAMLSQEIEALKANPPADLPEIHLRRGAGAYVCGEESAMIESLEGKRGMPRLRPPYLAEVGLFGLPTLEQNMETMHWVREIIEKGADWFASHGRNGRQGLRTFSVSGRVNKPGVYLAPAGISMNELIDEYCGGMQAGHKFYGYFPGGASGGILPASLGNIPLDFDTLNEYGCFIGSAAIVVMSEQDSAKKLALNAMRFFAEESCGQCTPCRVGTAKAAELMAKANWDNALLEDLSAVMVDASICGLGQAAPNPLRCAIKYFPQEFSSDEQPKSNPLSGGK